MIVMFFSLLILPVLGLFISSAIALVVVEVARLGGLKLHWLTSGLLVAASGWFGGIATLICIYARIAY